MTDMHAPIVPKNTGSNEPSQAAITEPPLLRQDTVVIDPMVWLRRFLAANPFYLLSFVLLLYGIYRVSSDTGFLRVEVQQLFFNFTALQLYEITLVGLALLLARKLVWYDSTLLVFLENLVVVVPFILVTQASLIEQNWIWLLCLTGGVLAVARVGLLKRFLRELNLPWSALALGAVLLLANTILPIVYRELQEDRMGKGITWGPAYEMNELSWLVVLPLLIAGYSLLPKPASQGRLWPQRNWIPLAIAGSWVVATGVHLYALSYVYTFPMRAALWAPTLLALAWTGQARCGDFWREPARAPRILLLVLPFPLAFLALGSGDVSVACALLMVNTALYIIAAVRGSDRHVTGHLALASGVAALVCMPAIGQPPTPDSKVPGEAIGAALAVYVLLASLMSRRCLFGLAGAMAAGWGLSMVAPESPIAFQAALVFLLLHSLRWKEPLNEAARALRWVSAGIWVLHSWIWVASEGMTWSPTGVAAGVLLIWTLVFWLSARRPTLIVPITAGIVGLGHPMLRAGEWLIAAPAGPLALAGSFTLLAIGTGVALTKHRWRRAAED